MPGNYTLRKTYVDGDILSASDYVADHQQHIDNQDPQHTNDYSDNVTQMRTLTDHGDVTTESLATTLAGEIERLRFAIKDIKSKLNGTTIAQWYSKSYAVVTADGAITTAKLANGATFLQFVQSTAGANQELFFGSGEKTLHTLAITLTRSRVLVRFVADGWNLGPPVDSVYTFRIKRDGVTVATFTTSVFASGVTAISPFSFPRTFVDTPGVGTFTYTITGDSTGASADLSVRAWIALEEVA